MKSYGAPSSSKLGDEVMLGATTNLRGRSTHTNEPLQSNHRAKATEATLFPTNYSALRVGVSSLCRRCRLIAVAADRRQRARLTDSHRASTKPTRAFATKQGNKYMPTGPARAKHSRHIKRRPQQSGSALHPAHWRLLKCPFSAYAKETSSVTTARP
jgi:hypothetical protein